jgi:hypothetical protein
MVKPICSTQPAPQDPAPEAHPPTCRVIAFLVGQNDLAAALGMIHAAPGVLYVQAGKPVPLALPGGILGASPAHGRMQVRQITAHVAPYHRPDFKAIAHGLVSIWAAGAPEGAPAVGRLDELEADIAELVQTVWEKWGRGHKT